MQAHPQGNPHFSDSPCSNHKPFLPRPVNYGLNHTTPVTYAKYKNNLKLLKGQQKEYTRQQRILNLNI